LIEYQPNETSVKLIMYCKLRVLEYVCVCIYMHAGTWTGAWVGVEGREQVTELPIDIDFKNSPTTFSLYTTDLLDFNNSNDNPEHENKSENHTASQHPPARISCTLALNSPRKHP